MKTINPDKLGLSKDRLMAMENFFKEKYPPGPQVGPYTQLFPGYKIRLP